MSRGDRQRKDFQLDVDGDDASRKEQLAQLAAASKGEVEAMFAMFGATGAAEEDALRAARAQAVGRASVKDSQGLFDLENKT